MFSQQLEDRGCCPLSCKQKRPKHSSQPAEQTHTPAGRAAPGGLCTAVAQGVVGFPITALSFMQRPAQECISAWLSKAPFHEFIGYTHTASGVKMLCSSLRKETSFTQTRFKMCLQEKMSPDIIIIIKGYLLYIKSSNTGNFQRFIDSVFFFKTINSNSINLVTTVCRQEEAWN